MARAPAFEKTRNELTVTFAKKSPVDRSRLVRQAARMIVEEGPESEATGALRSSRTASAHAVPKLIYAALIRASETSKRIVNSEFELKRLESPREHLNRVHIERTAPVKLSASRPRISGNGRTLLLWGSVTL